MQTESREKPKSLVGKALWVLKYRPETLFATARGYFLFGWTRLLLTFFGFDPSNVQLGQNVRLQKRRCLSAEKPYAKILIGDHSIVYENAEISSYGDGKIQLGECAVLGDIRIASRYSVTIGHRFISSWNVFIQDYDPHPILPEERALQIQAICAGFRPKYAPTPFSEKFDWNPPGEAIEIGNDVWVGANSTILKGAKIGSGCMIATGSVVLAGIYPDRSLIAGSPARVIKQI
jgi:acetyltransferase-like isoleucine patch superfamily enzyme